GQSTASTASTPSGGRKAAQNSRVSPGPLYIFQFAAISTGRASYEPPSLANRKPLSNRLLLGPACGKRHADGMTATPGRSLPSRSSKAAPPPVESHETSSSRPSSRKARAESAPPTTE